MPTTPDLPPPAPLVAQAVTLTYPRAEAPAIVDVDLDVRPGECVALLGPNGAGKTTFIRTVTGLATPDTGTVRVAGGDPRDATTRLALGVMLQETAFPRHLTVRELVTGAAVRAGRPRDAVAGSLAEVGLSDLAHRRSAKLSGGQRRRLQLACALVTDPALLVLDEPTEGLDAEARQAFWQNLAARRDTGMAILLTTHLIEEAGAVADRVVVIADGRVVADADPASLSDRLPDRRISLRTATPLEEVRGRPDVLHADAAPAADGRPPLLRITTRQPEAVVRDLLVADPSATDLRVEGASLEEAVMAVAQRPTPAPVPTRTTRTSEVSR